MLYDERKTIDTPPHKVQEATALADGLADSDMHSAASGYQFFAHRLETNGRHNEAAFWRGMYEDLFYAIGRAANGASSLEQLKLHRAHLRSRLLNLKDAVDADDNDPAAQPDSGGARNARRALSRVWI